MRSHGHTERTPLGQRACNLHERSGAGRHHGLQHNVHLVRGCGGGRIEENAVQELLDGTSRTCSDGVASRIHLRGARLRASHHAAEWTGLVPCHKPLWHLFLNKNTPIGQSCRKGSRRWVSHFLQRFQFPMGCSSCRFSESSTCQLTEHHKLVWLLLLPNGFGCLQKQPLAN